MRCSVLNGGFIEWVFVPLLLEEEEEFRQLAADADVYEKISKSIAPSIFGSQDIKKSIACLLFGGSRKRYVRPQLYA